MYVYIHIVVFAYVGLIWKAQTGQFLGLADEGVGKHHLSVADRFYALAEKITAVADNPEKEKEGTQQENISNRPINKGNVQV